MNSIFGRFMETWILGVSYKVNVKPFGLHLLCKRPEVFMFQEPSKNWIYCLYLHFILNNKYIEIIYNLGDKTILYLTFNHINGFVGVQNGKAEQPVWTRTADGANMKLILHMQLRCGSLAITTPVSHLANKWSFYTGFTVFTNMLNPLYHMTSLLGVIYRHAIKSINH